jgi:hypothetical protein
MLRVTVIALCLVCLVAGCKKSSQNPVGLPQSQEDWTFPASSTKFSVTLIPSTTAPAVGEAFDVKVVLYNCPEVFGAALDIAYASDKVDISSLVDGPYLSPDTAAIAVSNIDPATGIAGFGLTYKAGSATAASSGTSGVLMKLKCRAKGSGSAPFTIVPQTLRIVRADGTPIPGFAAIALESDTIAVH